MNKRTKVLFVVMDFWQAGAERFAYEVDCALDKSIFEVTILSVRGLNESPTFDDYYYSIHVGLGSKVIFLNELENRKNLIGRINNRVFSRFSRILIKNNELNALLKQFDVISWMGEYTFVHLLKYLDDSVYNKSIIHLMNAKFQNVLVYDLFPKDKHYIFTSGFDDEVQVKYELSDFNNYKYVLFPLLLNLTVKVNQWKFKNKKKKKIGVFTRLDPMKPLDPFIYAFHLLLDAMPDLELHIFGSGDPIQSGMQNYVRHLGNGDNIFFRGHQNDIVQTTFNEELDLVWFQGYKNRPAGYAGFDICVTGTPQLFWDFTYSINDLKHEGVAYPNFKNLNLFVSKSIEVLKDEGTAMSLSKLQFEDLLQKRDISKYIYILENLYLEVSYKKDFGVLNVKSINKQEIVLN